MRAFALVLLSTTACAPAPPALAASRADRTVIGGVQLVGRQGRFDVELERGKIARVVPHSRASDFEGRWIVPAFIDAHVHLAYEPVPAELVRRGVIGAVDLAAPLAAMRELAAGTPLRVISSGPMITLPRGYPTRGWGQGGYGEECATSSACEAAIDRLAAAGARLIKIPLAGDPEFDEATLTRLIAKAHDKQLKVAVHALEDGSARRAARAGADLLAHTPIEPLSDETVRLWSKRAVISTLDAFGAIDSTIDNLRALRAAGATILYGTDLGNTSDAGINAAELVALREAGLDTGAIIEAATRAPAKYFGFEDLGEIEPGKSASFLIYEELDELSRPAMIFIDGAKI